MGWIRPKCEPCFDQRGDGQLESPLATMKVSPSSARSEAALVHRMSRPGRPTTSPTKRMRIIARNKPGPAQSGKPEVGVGQRTAVRVQRSEESETRPPTTNRPLPSAFRPLPSDPCLLARLPADTIMALPFGPSGH